MKPEITKKNVAEHIEALIENKEYEVALDFIKRYKMPGFTVTQSTLKADYKLTKEQIESLVYVEVKNPHYATSKPMKLFLKGQIQQFI